MLSERTPISQGFTAMQNSLRHSRMLSSLGWNSPVSRITLHDIAAKLFRRRTFFLGDSQPLEQTLYVLIGAVLHEHANALTRQPFRYLTEGRAVDDLNQLRLRQGDLTRLT